MTIIAIFFATFFLYSSLANDSGWFTPNINPDSQRPSPSSRSLPKLMRKNSTHAILYGGYRERIAFNLGENVFYNDMYLLDVSDPELILWTKIQYATTAAPPARYTECAVYSASQNAVFLYGGLNYTSDFSNSLIFGDSWVFHFSTNTWTRLDELAPPGTLTGHSCDLDYSGDNLIITHGLALNDTNQGVDTTWRWSLATNTWTPVTVSSALKPVKRWLMNMHLIPGETSKFLCHHGRQPRSGNNNIYTDVWIMDVNLNSNTVSWAQLTITNTPPNNEVQSFALLSDKYLLMSGGDADGTKTTADTCKPPLTCIFPVTPQFTNYFLRLHLSQLSGNWQAADFEHNSPAHRHAAIVIMEPYLYMYGGHDWDGQHGIGEIFNPLTWGLKPNQGFW